jgi:hypothetical protein
MSHRIRAYLATLAVAAAACDTVPTAPTSVEPPPAVMTPVPSGLVGSYLLTLEIDASCAAVPPGERTRRYDATVARLGGRLVVTLAGAPFLDGGDCTGGGSAGGLGCHQFVLSEDLDWVGADLRPRDDVRGGHIVERVSTGGWIEITGHASGELSNLADISLEGPARAWFCPDDVGAPFDAPCAGSRSGRGTAAPPAARSCESSRMRLQFTRR